MRTPLEHLALQKIEPEAVVRFIKHGRITRLLIKANWKHSGKMRIKEILHEFLGFKFYGDDKIISYDDGGWDLWLNEDSLK